MRTVRLARTAAEAEVLRLRLMVQRMVIRIIMAVIALIFAVGVLAFVHVALWYVLRLHADLTQIWTAVALGGGDLVIAALLLLLASRSTPSRAEEEALEVRKRAWEATMRTLALSAMLMPALRMGTGMLRRRRGRD
ncbi:MAG: hypothetical protein J0H67_19375 [Rhodospirillales bacterium]|nr:hypothetical protein [Rhodospirillales bacterium]MBN8903745.1 hypothetical protein [Rhodospirillales bacterium]